MPIKGKARIHYDRCGLEDGRGIKLIHPKNAGGAAAQMFKVGRRVARTADLFDYINPILDQVA